MLSVNGIPVATVELKNPLTGQTIDDAVRQYQQDATLMNRSLSSSAGRLSISRSIPTWPHDDAARGSGDAFPALQPRDENGPATRPTPVAYRTAYLWE